MDEISVFSLFGLQDEGTGGLVDFGDEGALAQLMLLLDLHKHLLLLFFVTSLGKFLEIHVSI